MTNLVKMEISEIPFYFLAYLLQSCTRSSLQQEKILQFWRALDGKWELCKGTGHELKLSCIGVGNVAGW